MPSGPAPTGATLAAIALLSVPGCAGDEPAQRERSGSERAPVTTKGELARAIGLRWQRDVGLEESERTVNVEIAVRATRDGDFLVADAAESRVRRYGPDGSLKWAFGHGGSGPLGFDGPSVALRVGDDSILVVDHQAKIALVSPTGDSLLSTFTARLGPIYDADVLGDGRVLVSGRSTDGSDRLHVVDYRTGEIVRSFFPPPVGDQRSVNAAGLTNSSVRGDTIATVFALDDAVHYHHVDGRKLGRRPFESEHFRPWNAPPPARTGARVHEWYRSFSYTTEVFRPSDSLTVVQYQDRGRDLTPRWRLVGLRPDGSTAFDLRDTPRLLTVVPPRSELVFVTPGSPTPNRLSIAALRRGGR